jgi:tetratricopeptide (TPR) repeat protein
MSNGSVSSTDAWGVFSQSYATSSGLSKALRSDDPVTAAQLARRALASGDVISSRQVLEVTDALRRRGLIVEGVRLLISSLTAQPADGELRAALDQLLEHLDVGEDASIAHFLAAEFYAGQSDAHQAERHYSRSLAASPQSSEALVGLIQVLLSEDKSEQAESALETWRPGAPTTPQDFALRAAVLGASRGAETAIEIVDRGLDHFPDDWTLLSLRALLLMQAGRHDEAEKVMRHALHLQPDDVGMRLALTQLLLDRGQLEEVPPFLDALLHDFPGDANVRASHARLLLLSERPIPAAEVLAQALEEHPDAAVLQELLEPVFNQCMTLARDRYGTSDTRKEARGALDAALRLREGDIEANALLGELERVDGNLEAAYQRLARAEQEQGSPPSGWITGTLGQVLVSLGRSDEGLERLRHAFELDPNLDWVAIELADASRIGGNSREALTWALKATSVGPNNAWAWALLGATHLQMEAWEEARSALDHALKLEPTYAWALGVKASLLASIDEFDDALVTVENAVHADESAAWVLGLKVWILRISGAKPEVIETAARAALRLDPTSPELVIGLGESLLRQGRMEEAREQFRDGAALASRGDESRDGDTIAALAWCRLRLREYDAALDALSEAINLGASVIPARFDTALTLLCKGRSRAAVDEYENTASLALAERHRGRRRFYFRVARADLTSLVVTGQLNDDEHLASVMSILSRAMTGELS